MKSFNSVSRQSFISNFLAPLGAYGLPLFLMYPIYSDSAHPSEAQQCSCKALQTWISAEVTAHAGPQVSVVQTARCQNYGLHVRGCSCQTRSVTVTGLLWIRLARWVPSVWCQNVVEKLRVQDGGLPRILNLLLLVALRSLREPFFWHTPWCGSRRLANE